MKFSGRRRESSKLGIAALFYLFSVYINRQGKQGGGKKNVALLVISTQVSVRLFCGLQKTADYLFWGEVDF